MAFSFEPYLTQRSGVWYFRRVVPLAVRPLLERRRFFFSLHTDSHRDAGKAVVACSRHFAPFVWPVRIEPST